MAVALAMGAPTVVLLALEALFLARDEHVRGCEKSASVVRNPR